MRKLTTILLAGVATLAFTACGGGGGSSSGGSNPPVKATPMEAVDTETIPEPTIEETEQEVIPEPTVQVTPIVINVPVVTTVEPEPVIAEPIPVVIEEPIVMPKPEPVVVEPITEEPEPIIEEPVIVEPEPEPEPEPVVISEPIVLETFYKISQIDNDLDADGEIDITREQTTFDDRGNILSKMYRDKYGDPEALGNTSTYTYNDDDQVLTYENSTGSHGTYTYDSVGNLIRWTDNSYFTSYGYMVYDADNNLIENWYFTDDRESHYGYNTMSTYTYEDANIVTAATDKFSGDEPNGIDDIWEYKYDANGNQIYQSQILSNGETVNMYSISTYEENHLIEVEVSFGYRVIYTYDNRWNVILETYFWDDVQDSQTIRTYDINNNMLSVIGQNGYEIYWTYDENSNMLSIKGLWMNGDVETWYTNTYTYENNNMMSDSSDRDSDGVSEFMTRYTYDENDNRLSASWAKGDEADIHQIEYYTWKTFIK